MAPGFKSALHEGHFVGVTLFVAVGAEEADAVGDSGEEPDGGSGAAGWLGAGAPDETAAPTACRWGAPMVKRFLQVGQRTCLPPASSGTLMRVLQVGQPITCGMIILTLGVFRPHRAAEARDL